MPPNANQAMAALREFARSITAGKREEPEAQSVATTAELASMPLPDAFAASGMHAGHWRCSLLLQWKTSPGTAPDVSVSFKRI